MRWGIKAAFGLLVFFTLISAQAEDWTGKCVGVTDGDTISVLHNGKAEKIRLDGIDAPESHQAWGTQAKNALSTLVFGKDVYVYDKGKERYGRTLGIVINPSNLNVNATLVRSGFAWHYKQYSKDSTLAEAEVLARKEKRGLWKDPNPIPPWDFRRGITTTTGTLATLPPMPSPIAPLVGSTTTTSTQAQTVYVTNSGTKYHQAGCRYLGKSSIPMALAQVAGRYQPCSVCNPPVVGNAVPVTTAPYALPYARAPSTTYGQTPAQTYSAPQQTQAATVYVTRTGAKYHRAGCRYLSKSMIPMSLSQAAQRYSPCSVCNPPRM